MVFSWFKAAESEKFSSTETRYSWRTRGATKTGNPNDTQLLKTALKSDKNSIDQGLAACFTCWWLTCREIFGGKKQNKHFFWGHHVNYFCELLLLNNEISISIMEWNSLWRCTDWQSCPSVGKPLMHPHVFVSLSHLLYVTHLSHGHEWPSSHRHWTVPPSDLQT